MGTSVVMIFNPTKVEMTDRRQSRLRELATKAGYDEVTLIETDEDDPGYAMTREALASDPDLILAAGGDGTIRAVASELRGQDVPMAIIPAGTGNLMARNLNIPLDLADALTVAFEGKPRLIDMVQVTVDDDTENPHFYIGMTGIGFDAELMSNTNEKLKKVMGPAAYAMSFGKSLGTEPWSVEFMIDGETTKKRDAVLMMFGNTSELTAGIELFPDAKPDDGVLNMVISAPETLAGWAKVAAIVFRRERDDAVEYFEGTKFDVKLDQPTMWEMDGDTIGEGSHFVFEILPSAVSIVAPVD